MPQVASHRSTIDYSNELLEVMKKFYQSLSEKDRRRYAAIEAQKLGHGGISYIAKVFGCSRDTIKAGMNQLESLNIADLNTSNIRKSGAGRKRILDTMPGLEEAFYAIIQKDNSVHKQVYPGRINLSQRQIAERLGEKGFNVSVTVIKQLIKQYKQQK